MTLVPGVTDKDNIRFNSRFAIKIDSPNDKLFEIPVPDPKDSTSPRLRVSDQDGPIVTAGKCHKQTIHRN